MRVGALDDSGVDETDPLYGELIGDIELPDSLTS